jgi:hypothetical protein
MTLKKFGRFIPGIAWFFVILFLITLPKEDMPDAVGWWGWLEKLHFDKWVHAGMFAVQAWLLIIPINKFEIPLKEKWQWMLRVCMAVIVWGIFTEVIQLYVPGRSFDLLDWAADSLGALLALLLAKRLFLRNLGKKSID